MQDFKVYGHIHSPVSMNRSKMGKILFIKDSESLMILNLGFSYHDLVFINHEDYENTLKLNITASFCCSVM